MAGDKLTPFGFLAIAICPCGVLFKYIMVMGFLVTLVCVCLDTGVMSIGGGGGICDYLGESLKD